MRKNFYEILADMEFNYYDEYKKLLYLFNEEKCVTGYGRYKIPVCDYVDEKYFRKLPIRGTCTSLTDFMKEIPIKRYPASLDDLFLLAEFLIAILPENEIMINSSLVAQTETIMENISVILEKTNHELIELPEKENQFIIVEKNKGATRAAEIVEDVSVAIDLLEYNHFAMKGDLAGKKKLLTSIGAYIEPILKSRVLQKAGYKQLETDMGFVLNNFHIRHNNKEGAKAQEYILSCSEEQLEAWYDRAYNMAVAVIIINEHIPVETEIANLKRDYNWKA